MFTRKELTDTILIKTFLIGVLCLVIFKTTIESPDSFQGKLNLNNGWGIKEIC